MDLSSLEIAIPTYNRAPCLEKRIAELLPLQKKYGFRLLIFDNGSTDSTPQVCHTYRDNPLFQYHQAPLNGGISWV